MFKKQWKKLKKDQRGLTLVELLAVVVILAIVAAIAFIAIGNVIDNSRKDAHIANAQQVISAAKVYDSSGGDVATNGVTVKKLKDDGYLSEIQNPWKSGTYDVDSAKVTKEGTVYKISGFNGSKCTLKEIDEATLNKEGRDNCNK